MSERDQPKHQSRTEEGTETSDKDVWGLGVLIDAPHGAVQYVPTDSPAAVEWAKARGAALAAAAGQSSPSSYPCSTAMPDSDSATPRSDATSAWNVAGDHSLPGGMTERYVAAGVLIVRMRGDKVLADLCRIRNDAKSHTDVKQIAGEIAAALNETQEVPWEGDGPTVEEVGDRLILGRFGPALAAGQWLEGRWVFQGVSWACGKPDSWRRVPPVRQAAASAAEE